MIRRARRDGREARGNEIREKREDEKGSHCFFKQGGNFHLKVGGAKSSGNAGDPMLGVAVGGGSRIVFTTTHL